MEGRFLFLGTGASLGVPVIGCDCAVCRSSSPYNKRLRPSGLVLSRGKRFVIDVGPDFRQQALKYEINELDGILLTHTHFDHSGGIDDLRPYYFMQKKSLPCLLSKESYEDLKIRYNYLMHPSNEHLDFKILNDDFGSLNFEGVEWEYVSYYQAGMKVTGFRLGELAYISDIRTFDERIFKALQGTKILIVSALRFVPSHMHFSLDEAIDFAKKLNVEKVWFTHIAHELDHESVNQKLPNNMQLSYDGLEISFNDVL